VAFRVSATASQRLDEIFVYTRDTWGQDQAEAYIRGLFGCFERIARHDIVSRAIRPNSGSTAFIAATSDIMSIGDSWGTARSASSRSCMSACTN